MAPGVTGAEQKKGTLQDLNAGAGKPRQTQHGVKAVLTAGEFGDIVNCMMDAMEDPDEHSLCG